jgi:hypothetical protein
LRGVQYLSWTSQTKVWIPAKTFVKAIMKILVTLGDFSREHGQLVLVDLLQETWEIVLDYLPPSHLQVYGKGFTGAAWTGNPGTSDLLVCGYAAVFRVNPNHWCVTDILHRPDMNDLHHLAIVGEQLYIVNTGLDRIDCYLMNGGYLGGYDLIPAWLGRKRQTHQHNKEDCFAIQQFGWTESTPKYKYSPARISSTEAYYQNPVETQLPFHRRRVRDCIHPNHLSVFRQQLLVTRFRDRCVQDVQTWRIVIDDLPGYPHDGFVQEGRFWLTTTNGYLLAYAVDTTGVTNKRLMQIALFDRFEQTGWCRGLLVTEAYFIVALTRIYERKIVRWCDRTTEQTETSILLIRRQDLSLCARVKLHKVSPQPKIFTLLPWL